MVLGAAAGGRDRTSLRAVRPDNNALSKTDNTFVYLMFVWFVGQPRWALAESDTSRMPLHSVFSEAWVATHFNAVTVYSSPFFPSPSLYSPTTSS